MKPATKADNRAPIPPTLDEVIAEIKRNLPESPEGTFCLGDLIKHGLPQNIARRLLLKWRDEGRIEPAGRIVRKDPWDISRTVPAYKFAREK